MTDWVAIAISIVALIVSIGSIVYSRQQARTAERTRKSEHDAHWRLTWDATHVIGTGLNEFTGEYQEEWVLHAENIGRGTAFDLTATTNGRTRHGRDVKPGEKVWLTDEQAVRVDLQWTTLDRLPQTWRGDVPSMPTLPPGIDESDL